MFKRILSVLLAAFVIPLFSVFTHAQKIAVGVLCTSNISAQSAILIDAHDGKILFEKNSKAKMGMASTTKIMTALVVIESCSLDESIAIDPRAIAVEGSSI